MNNLTFLDLEEEINTLMKPFTADIQRLDRTLETYKQNKPDADKDELGKRQQCIRLLREAKTIFLGELEEQTIAARENRKHYVNNRGSGKKNKQND